MGAKCLKGKCDHLSEIELPYLDKFSEIAIFGRKRLFALAWALI
jgi:hypothetical protein